MSRIGAYERPRYPFLFGKCDMWGANQPHHSDRAEIDYLCRSAPEKEAPTAQRCVTPSGSRANGREGNSQLKAIVAIQIQGP